VHSSYLGMGEAITDGIGGCCWGDCQLSGAAAALPPSAALAPRPDLQLPSPARVGAPQCSNATDDAGPNPAAERIRQQRLLMAAPHSQLLSCFVAHMGLEFVVADWLSCACVCPSACARVCVRACVCFLALGLPQNLRDISTQVSQQRCRYVATLSAVSSPRRLATSQRVAHDRTGVRVCMQEENLPVQWKVDTGSDPLAETNAAEETEVDTEL
jgi:hypothetical protein